MTDREKILALIGGGNILATLLPGRQEVEIWEAIKLIVNSPDPDLLNPQAAEADEEKH